MVLVPRLLAAAVVLALVGCRQQPAGRVPDNVMLTEADLNQPTASELPSVAPPLTRRDVLLAVTEAASAFGSGRDDSDQQQGLDGRPFSFRIRFCEGIGSSFQRRFDAETRVLNVEVRPNLDSSAPEIREVAGETAFEQVEGFWVPRPWLLQAACPSRPVSQPADAPNADEEQADEAPILESASPAQPSAVGIAQFYAQESARTTRRKDRPYQLTRKLAEGERPGPIDLVLQGRLRRLPGGKIISCTGQALTGPPTCIVSVQVDRVLMADEQGQMLADWSDG
jgi:hypothetical protein